MIKIKSKETLRLKKELFTKKIINLYTQQRIINHFLKRTLLLTQFETLNLNLPLFIKRILIKKDLKINLYDQIIRSTYLLTDISNYNNEKTIIKNFIRNDKVKKTLVREKPIKCGNKYYISLSSEIYMNNFLHSESLEMNNKKKYYKNENKQSHKNLFQINKKISFFDLKAFTNIKTKKNSNLFRRREKALSTHKTYSNRRDKKKRFNK